ncbi:MAG: class I SAM-dependent methyltransferase [Bdellovibrionota bacterium]
MHARHVFWTSERGTARLPQWYHFEEALALEPNLTLGENLRRRCPGINVLPKRIDDVHMNLHADLIVCSHVLYYIDRTKWMAVLDKLASWLSPGGTLVCILQTLPPIACGWWSTCTRIILTSPVWPKNSISSAGHRYRQNLRTSSVAHRSTG